MGIELRPRKIATAVIAGKPKSSLFLGTLARNNATSKDAIMIGDQLEADIFGALRVGIDTILVGTGITGHSDDAEIKRFPRWHRAPTHSTKALTPILHRLDQNLRSI